VRLLLVHAHPDDETINNGATMARYVAEGHDVTLVTCTAGERGEVLVPDLEHLRHDRDDNLGPHRRQELAAAMAELGVTDSRFLGGFGRFHDSGMEWHAEGYAVAGDDRPDGAFWDADLTEAADLLVEIIREVRPHALVTYDQFGGYGHPDHIQAHRVAMYAASLAGVPSYRLDLGAAWDVPKIYWNAMSESRMREAVRRMRANGDEETFAGLDPDGPMPPFVTPDELISTRIDARDYAATKLRALKQHATQVETDGPMFRGAESGQSEWGEEDYRIAKGTFSPEGDGHETDLFAGLPRS
jgi:N-acetyl-1-D-myo-inositol-2-amino-2-deoxy-alpha-D-glucopyranoside deacetylase